MSKKQKPLNTKSNKNIGLASITAQDNFDPHTLIAPHSAPIYTSSTYVYESAEKAQQVFRGEEKAYIYSRWSHPNAELAESKIEQLETYGLNVKAKALLFSTGMGAISALFQSLLQPGDAVLAQGNIYGTTVDYFNHYGDAYKIQVIYADFANLNSLEETLKQHKNIKLLYTETPSNPTLNCYNLKAIADLAHKYKAKAAVDNTFASPYLQQPFKFGIDYIVHSATKYLNGHGTALSGALLSTDVKRMNDTVWKVRKINGTICSPFDAWLLNLGMKTLSLRMEQHCANAMAVAKYLQSHEAISKVNYLGLKDHPDHALAKKQMRNYGGVLSFELKKGYKAGEKLMKKIKFCKLTASLGTIDTLIQHPASMSHYFVPKAQREQYGITDGLIRLSVGIEDVNDVIADLENALR
jgi:methionine-gamma-lyase